MRYESSFRYLNANISGAAFASIVETSACAYRKSEKAKKQTMREFRLDIEKTDTADYLFTIIGMQFVSYNTSVLH
jgi:hypothetical protein